MAKVPLIDSRDMNMLVKKMKAMVPFYTPEWKFSVNEHDPGSALFMSFAEMYAGLINRFNRVPEKNFIAFLNMLDLKLLPAQPAVAPLSFKLSTGAAESVLVPAGIQVAASVADVEGPVIFETMKNMLATPASLNGAFNISTKHDIITRVSDGIFGDPREAETTEATAFGFFAEENLQEHVFYISHADLFNVNSPSMITLQFHNTRQTYKEKLILEGLSRPDYVQWQYWGEIGGVTGWHDFEQSTLKGDKLILCKNRTGWLTETEVNGVNGRWLRCTGLSANMEALREVEIDSIKLCVDYFDPATDNLGIAPDMQFYNDLPLDQYGIYPFGEFFVLYDTFYIASREVFSKKGAEVTLNFDCEIRELVFATGAEPEIKWKLIMKKSDFAKKEPLKKTIAKVSWEYWNGTGWLKLLSDAESEAIFTEGDGRRTITFKCPQDMSESWVNNQENYWIRARVTKIDNLLAASMVYRTPNIGAISLKYRFNECDCLVDRCLTFNDMEYREQSEFCRQAGSAFPVFYSQDCTQPAFYLGFDRPPVSGPISIYFSITEQVAAEGNPPPIEWQYLKSDGGRLEWAKLKVDDRTNHLSQSGTVVFAGPPDYAEHGFFGSGPYWIRLVNTDAQFDILEGKAVRPKLNHIYMNTTLAVQQESAPIELLGPVEGQPNKEFALAKAPIINEELWVNELRDLTEAERNRLAAGPGIITEAVKDDYGHVIEFWVKWQVVEDIFDSGANDRHYIVDRAMGKIQFGDGNHGKIPPSFKENGIKVQYKIGGGTKGNVKAFEIASLHSPVAFIHEVFNPEPAKGGSDMEVIAKAIKRGPQQIRHRQRAVTAEDFEDLARQSSRSIAKVKCLPNFNSRGEREHGWVTVVILPESEGSYERPSPELKMQVQSYLAERAVNTVVSAGRLRVTEPVYMEISIYAILTAENMDIVSVVENTAVDRLNHFMDPLRGGYDGAGWEIGQQPHISMFYSLLKAIPGVNFVEKVSMTVKILIDGQAEEIDPAKLTGLPHVLVVNGKHKVDVLST